MRRFLSANNICFQNELGGVLEALEESNYRSNRGYLNPDLWLGDDKIYELCDIRGRKFASNVDGVLTTILEGALPMIVHRLGSVGHFYADGVEVEKDVNSVLLSEEDYPPLKPRLIKSTVGSEVKREAIIRRMDDRKRNTASLAKAIDECRGVRPPVIELLDDESTSQNTPVEKRSGTMVRMGNKTTKKLARKPAKEERTPAQNHVDESATKQGILGNQRATMSGKVKIMDSGSKSGKTRAKLHSPSDDEDELLNDEEMVSNKRPIRIKTKDFKTLKGLLISEDGIYPNKELRGIFAYSRSKTEVKLSPIHGYGIFHKLGAPDRQIGEIIDVYSGRIVNEMGPYVFDVSGKGDQPLLIDSDPSLGEEVTMWGRMNQDLLNGNQNTKMLGGGYLEIIKVVKGGDEYLTK